MAETYKADEIDAIWTKEKPEHTQHIFNVQKVEWKQFFFILNFIWLKIFLVKYVNM